MILASESNDFQNILAAVLKELIIDEIGCLIRARSIRTDQAMFSLFKQQRAKYVKICDVFNAEINTNKFINKRVNLAYTGFDEVIKHIYPHIYKQYLTQIQ